MSKKTFGKWSLIIIALSIAIAAIFRASSDGKDGSTTTADTLDYTKPIYTIADATTCNGVLAFSKIANDIHDGYTPKFAEYGCRIWPDGVPVHVVGKVDSYRDVDMADIDGTRVSGYTLFTMLRNDTIKPLPAPRPPAPSSPTVATSPSDAGMPDNIRREISKFDEVNDVCRDASGENTQAACDLRDKMFDAIKKEGWCWNVEGVAEAAAKWSHCPNASQLGSQ